METEPQTDLMMQSTAREIVRKLRSAGHVAYYAGGSVRDLLRGQVPKDIEKIPTQPVDGKIRWIYSYAEGKRLAQASFKPMFVVFRCER